LAEGSTLDGIQEYVTIQNPEAAAATVTLDFGLEGGGRRSTTVTVPGNQRRTVDVNSVLGTGVTGHSTTVTSDRPVLVERPMYFNRAVGDDGVTINGGHVAFGTAPASQWMFAEGTLLPDFATYLTLANPDPTAPATADITYYFSDGSTASRTATVAAGSRRTVRVFDAADPAGVGRDSSDPVSRGFATKITVVERPEYFHHRIGADGPEINDGHDVTGAQALASSWAFAEGSTLSGFYPFLTVWNPAAEPVALTLTYTPDQGVPVVRHLTVNPTSRLTVQVYGDSGQGGIGASVTGFGIVAAASRPVLVERPLYVTRDLPGLPLVNGGSDVIGFPATP
jgi:hypothetical protein